MTKEEFENNYCEGSGITRKVYDEYRVTLPCNCSEEACEGWACVANDELSIKWHNVSYERHSSTHYAEKIKFQAGITLYFWNITINNQKVGGKMKRVAIVGTGGHGREVAWIASQCGDIEVIGFITKDTSLYGQTLCDLPVLGDNDWLYGKDIYAVCAIGNPKIKEKAVNELSANGVKFIQVIDPTALISKFSEIGEGCLIFPNTIISTQVKLGNHVHVNSKSSISHDSVIEDFATLAPSVNICGNVRIKHGADIGVGASVIQGITIGSGSVIGAGASVTRDISDNVVAVGVPAKPIKPC